MTQLWPGSMKNRTVLAVVTLIIMSHLLALGIYLTYNAASLSQVREQHVADQLVTFARLLEREPSHQRQETAVSLSDHSLQISLDPLPRVSPQEAGEEDTQALRRLLGLAMDASFNKNVLADYREISGVDLDQVTAQDAPNREIFAQRVTDIFRFQEDLLVSIHLSDGQWLNALVPGDGVADYINLGLVSSVVLMTVITLMLVTWAVCRPLNVLSNFTAVAEAMGRNPVHSEPVAEEGPIEIRRAAHAFNRMQQRVKNLVEDRTRMVAAISHDFRTPLTRMRLRAEYIGNERERNNMFEDIADMECMISSTLRFVEDELTEEPRFRVEFVSLLSELAQELGVSPPQVNLHGLSELTYLCSPVALKRAFTNLINNALMYGRCAIIRVDLQPNDLLVCIDDQGPGIPEPEREKVFLPFYRQEPSRCRNTGGTGLGLSIARSIIRAHGGDIVFTESPEGGCRAKVNLPWKAELPGNTVT